MVTSQFPNRDYSSFCILLLSYIHNNNSRQMLCNLHILISINITAKQYLTSSFVCNTPYISEYSVWGKVKIVMCVLWVILTSQHSETFNRWLHKYIINFILPWNYSHHSQTASTNFDSTKASVNVPADNDATTGRTVENHSMAQGYRSKCTEM